MKEVYLVSRINNDYNFLIKETGEHVYTNGIPTHFKVLDSKEHIKGYLIKPTKK